MRILPSQCLILKDYGVAVGKSVMFTCCKEIIFRYPIRLSDDECEYGLFKFVVMLRF